MEAVTVAGKKYFIIYTDNPNDAYCSSCVASADSELCGELPQGCGNHFYYVRGVSGDSIRSEVTPETKKQIGGDHYLKAIQPWDIIRAWDLNYWEGNLVKYVLRHRFKNQLEDIEKAIHYLEYIRDNYEELYDTE